MVIVFATVVFTGSIIKGAQDYVGSLFPKVIKTDPESRSNKSAISAEPHDTFKISPCGQKLPRHFPDHPKDSTITQTRCFQSYSAEDFFSGPEEVLTVKDQGDIHKEIREPKQDISETNSTKAELDHAMNATSRIGDVVLRLVPTEDQETVEIGTSNNGKLKIVSFQTCPSQSSPVRHRRKRPKTLKKELEEAGMLISKDGETQSTMEPLKECVPQDQCDEVNSEEKCVNIRQTRIKEENLEDSSPQEQCDRCDEVSPEFQHENVKRGKPNEINPIQSEVTASLQDSSGYLQSPLDDVSMTKDEPTGSTHHKSEEYKDTTKPGEEILKVEDATVSCPVMMNDKLEEEEKAPPSEARSKGEATEDENKNILHVIEEEKDDSSKDISNGSHNADTSKAQSPQEIFCNQQSRPTNEDGLSESKRADAPAIIDAGDALQSQMKSKKHQGKGTISETGDSGRPTEMDRKGVSATNVNFVNTTGVKHRSQKGLENNSLFHRDSLLVTDAALKEIAQENTSDFAKDSWQSRKKTSKDEPQPSTAQQIETVTTKSNGKDVVANDTSSAVKTSNSHLYCNRRLLENSFNQIARVVNVPDRLDQAVARFNTRDVEIVSRQDCVYDQERMISEVSDLDKPIGQYPGSITDDSQDCFTSIVPSKSNQKEEDQDVLESISCRNDPSVPSHEVIINDELHGLLEDFSAVDCVRAYWSHDVVHNDPSPYSNNDVIVMAVENRDQQRRRMERRQLRERIAKATQELDAVTRDTERQEGRLIKLAQEVGNFRSESEKSEQELQEEQDLYRESVLRCCKMEEGVKAFETRSQAVESELQALKRREWKTGIMLKTARGEIKLLDHRILKEQTLQEEQRDKRLRDKRRRFQRTSLKFNTLVVLVILQIILVIIIALWRL